MELTNEEKLAAVIIVVGFTAAMFLMGVITI